MKLKELAAVSLLALTCGCAQTMTKDFGGSMEITLEPNQKLELITWKGDELWVLTRPMREGESAETHTYEEDSVFNILEGEVTIIEIKE